MNQKRGGFFSNYLTLIAISTLVGTIVGAGILAIPYVISQAGFLYGFILLLLLGFAFILINLFMGEVVLRTKEQYQLTGYAGKYLGKKGKTLMAFAMLFTIYGALTAYLIGEGATLQTIFGGGFQLLYSLIFFAVTFLIIYKGIKATGKTELILIGILLAIVVLIGFFSYDKINFTNLSGFNPLNFFLPYGVILFAYMAAPAIPEMQEVLGKHKGKMKKAIIIGSIIPIVLYLLFTIIIVGIIGTENFSLLAPNERIATVALSFYSHHFLSLLANILAVLAMFTSFLTLGIALIELYHYDYHLPRWLSLLLTFSLPLLIVIFRWTSFVSVIAITGSISGGIEGILMMLMYWKAKKFGDRKPEYQLGKFRILGTIFIIMFTFGIVYQIWSNFF